MEQLAGWMAATLAVLSIGATAGSHRAAGVARQVVRQQSNTASTHIYIVAHEDDWQPFMGEDAATAPGDGAPATFIYLTAGDDGRDSTYWLPDGRRNGAGFARDGY